MKAVVRTSVRRLSGTPRFSGVSFCMCRGNVVYAVHTMHGLRAAMTRTCAHAGEGGGGDARK